MLPIVAVRYTSSSAKKKASATRKVAAARCRVGVSAGRAAAARHTMHVTAVHTAKVRPVSAVNWMPPTPCLKRAASTANTLPCSCDGAQ